MKKINGIDTISAHHQLEIMRWYIISKRIILTLASILVTISFTQWYILRRYAPSCKPCITPVYADAISKKHAQQTGCIRHKKALEAEYACGTALLKNYISLIESHLNQTPHAHLTDLRITPQGFDAQYTSPHRSAVQHQLKELSANPAINAVSLNTIEQKNNIIISSLNGIWKKTKIN